MRFKKKEKDMETSLPIQGLACPSVQFDNGISPNEKKCGCTMKNRITGKVINAITKQPFDEPVHIMNLTTSFGVTTRLDGSFVIEASPNDVLQISYVEFEMIQIKASELPPVLALEPDDMLDEVVITVKKDAKKFNYLALGLLGGLLLYAVVKDDNKKSKKTNNTDS